LCDYNLIDLNKIEYVKLSGYIKKLFIYYNVFHAN